MCVLLGCGNRDEQARSQPGSNVPSSPASPSSPSTRPDIDAAIADESAPEPVGPPPPVVADAPSIPSGGCDADALVQAGQDEMSEGKIAKALARFDEAYQCKPSSNTANMVFLAACAAKNAAMAKRYHDKISNQGLVERCRDTKTAFE